VTIDEPTLDAIDRIARSGPRTSRSLIVRRALGEFVARREEAEREERERQVVAKHRDRLARQARALVAVQAKP
jgi:metal-responsive CopG/Arc/MetJ family transcriptional regulator